MTHQQRVVGGAAVDGSFADRARAAMNKSGPLVVGLDPSRWLLEEWGVGDSANGLDAFADTVVEALAGTAGIVKLQAAFYERHGWQGFRTLQRLAAECRSAEMLVIIDAKRGDVGSTNEAYADAYLGSEPAVVADALTVHPYLGLAAMDDFISNAHRGAAGLLVVVRSSNPEGRHLQLARHPDGTTVEAALLRQIGEINADLAPGRIGPVGAVVGPTPVDDPLDLVGANAMFLVPGIGAQGATISDVAKRFASCPDRVLPAAARSVLAAGPDARRLRDTAADLAAQLRQALAL